MASRSSRILPHSFVSLRSFHFIFVSFLIMSDLCRWIKFFDKRLIPFVLRRSASKCFAARGFAIACFAMSCFTRGRSVMRHFIMRFWPKVFCREIYCHEVFWHKAFCRGAFCHEGFAMRRVVFILICSCSFCWVIFHFGFLSARDSTPLLSLWMQPSMVCQLIAALLSSAGLASSS